MLYQITDGTLMAGSQMILAHFDFAIKGSDRIAIVGANGIGKTTLLRLIAGELSLERDDQRKQNGIRLARNVTIGMLHQQAFSDKSQTVNEIMTALCEDVDIWSRERFDFEQEYDRIFTGFGFAKADKEKTIASFSGGEQTKIALIRLLLQKPDILLLDEPTNHLDTDTVVWLEDYLRHYPKAVVMVSHDRFFLDRTAQIVYEMANGQLTRYVGNYTAYREQKYKKMLQYKKQYEQQQEEIKRLEGLIQRFKNKPKKAAFARSRKKILDRMEKIPNPETLDAHLITGDIHPAVCGSKWVFECEKMKIGYQIPLLELTLRIKRGQKIGIIGPNGAGKSTFLKTVSGILPPLSGRLVIGQQIETGYFDQQSAEIVSEQTILEYFRTMFPSMTEKEVRQYLAAYLFRGTEVTKQIQQLSGGERSRLALASILAQRPNFLVLDEPTNHMDIPAREVLESAFKAYKGTILFVSHDRYFVQEVADALLIFENETVTYYPFGYLHYLEQCHKIKQSGLSVTGAVLAENQALVEDLKNVPKGASLLGRELSTEQLYTDWQMRLAGERLEKVRKQTESVLAETEQKYYSTLVEWMDDTISEQADAEAMSVFEKACIEWYDYWLELVVNE